MNSTTVTVFTKDQLDASFQRLYPLMLGRVRRIVRDNDKALEIIGDAYVNAATKLHQCKSNLDSWLYAVCNSAMLTRYHWDQRCARCQGVDSVSEDGDNDRGIVDRAISPERNPEELLLAAELGERLMRYEAKFPAVFSFARQREEGLRNDGHGRIRVAHSTRTRATAAAYGMGKVTLWRHQQHLRKHLRADGLHS